MGKVPLAELLPFLEQTTGLDYILIRDDVPPDGAQITIQVETTVGHCLNLICELGDLSWTVEGNVVKIGKAQSLKGRAMKAPIPPVPDELRETLRREVSLPLQAVPMWQVVDILQGTTGAQLVLFEQDIPADGAFITLQFDGPLEEALDRICELAGLAWKIEGPVIKIGKAERFGPVTTQGEAVQDSAQEHQSEDLRAVQTGAKQQNVS